MTTTGAPITGSTTVISGANTIASGDLYGDVTTSGGTNTPVKVLGNGQSVANNKGWPSCATHPCLIY